MLVLTRKADEQILIGDDIKITLVKVRGGSVRIGIDAPKSVKIIRGELEPKDVKSAKREAVNSKPTVSKAADSKIEAAPESCEVYDDIAAVFAHPARNQVRSGPLRGKRLAGVAQATQVTAGKAKVQKSTRILNTLIADMGHGVAVSS